MGLNIGTPPSVQDLELLDVQTLDSANATITATLPSGYRYIKVVFQGFTTGDPGATAIKLRVNGASSNYQARAYCILTTTVSNQTATDCVPVSPSSAFGAAARVMVDIDISSLSGQNKQFSGTFSGLEPASPTYSGGIVSGVYNATDEITSVSLVLSASTWTTASQLRIYGGNI